MTHEPSSTSLIRPEWWLGKRVLITGGLGFIGSNLAHRLVGLGARVTLLDHLMPQFGGNRANIAGIEDRVVIEIADQRQANRLRPLLEVQEVVFNFAGMSSHMDSMQDPWTDLEMNVRSHLALLECCREFNAAARLVFASTRQVYGRPNALPVREDHPLRPLDINGIHKLAAEQYHLLAHQVHGLAVCVLRLTNTYGPRMRIKDARQTFLGVWVRQALLGQPWEVWGGCQLRDYTYIDDALDACLLAATHPAAVGQVFNVGGGEVLSLHETAQAMAAANEGGTFVVKEFPAERAQIDIGDYHADTGKILQHLGWQPRYQLRDGLGLTLDYFRPRLNAYL